MDAPLVIKEHLIDSQIHYISTCCSISLVIVFTTVVIRVFFYSAHLGLMTMVVDIQYL